MAAKRVRELLFPAAGELALSVASGVLLVLSFPDFNWWPLAWIALAPLMLATLRSARLAHALMDGWIAGTVFFYGSCYWITYSMIHYGGLPRWVAYSLLLLASAIVGLFTGFFALALSFVLRRYSRAHWMFAAPFLWAAFEFVRLAVAGQLWNAVGYSQAYVPDLIQVARYGGVYAVGFLIVLVNSAVVYVWLARSRRAFIISSVVVTAVFTIIISLVPRQEPERVRDAQVGAVVIGIQANVPMAMDRSSAQMEALLERHLLLSRRALESAAEIYPPHVPRVVVWSESPMNFAYARDFAFRSVVTDFARRHQTSMIFNSLEPAPKDGAYNSAMMIDEQGRLVTQYDKIRLLPFGEYVPIPKWLPGAGFVTAIVGDFTPGEKYPLLPIGQLRAGAFICIESAFPEVTRAFARQDVDFLINISNDGYLGPTPVLRQHLANVVFRAVETNRRILRVTNTGLTADVDARGGVRDVTAAFQTAVRVWPIARSREAQTFYTRYGDLFAYLCVGASVLLFASAARFTRRSPQALIYHPNSSQAKETSL
ncbi:MAG: apolipoprotein N-acyltransferase [Pyrinomonadaceae bacterium]